MKLQKKCSNEKCNIRHYCDNFDVDANNIILYDKRLICDSYKERGEWLSIEQEPPYKKMIQVLYSDGIARFTVGLYKHFDDKAPEWTKNFLDDSAFKWLWDVLPVAWRTKKNYKRENKFNKWRNLNNERTILEDKMGNDSEAQERMGICSPK